MIRPRGDPVGATVTFSLGGDNYISVAATGMALPFVPTMTS